MNFYGILGIPRNADEEAIRRAYRVLARRYHPDRGAGSSPEKFRQVNEAYETLSDPRSRRVYDLSLRTVPRPMSAPVEPMIRPPTSVYASPPPDLDELFDRLFRSFDLFFRF